MSSDENVESPDAETTPPESTAAATSSSSPDPASVKVLEPATPTRSFWTRVDQPYLFGLLVTLGGLTAFIVGMMISNLATVIIYVAFAAFAALGLDPAVRFLERRGLKRVWSVLTVIIGLLVVMALALWLIVPTIVEQVSMFVKSVPQLVKDFMSSSLYHGLEAQFGDQFEKLVKDVTGFLTDPGTAVSIGGGALQIGSSIASGISGFIIVLVLTLYFVAGLPTIKSSLLRLAPARNRARAADITDQITNAVGGYVMGMVTLAFFNAIVALLLFLFIGLPFPPLMATVAFFITMIPLIGPLLFLAIGTLIALFANPIGALIFALIYLIYIQVEAYVLTPRVMTKAVSVPGSLVVIGATAGGTLLGLLGALVAVPVTASVLIIIKQIWIPRQDSRV